MKTIYFCILIAFFFCAIACASELQLIRTDTVQAPSPITFIDPILGDGGDINGYILLFEDVSAIRLHWLDARPQTNIVVSGIPVQTLHWQSGDTLVVVATLKANQLSGSMQVVRIAIFGTEVSMTNVSLSIPQCLPGVSFESLTSHICGRTEPDGNFSGLIVSTSVLAYSIYGFEPEYARCSHTWVISPDLQEIVYEGNHGRFIPGQFSTDSILQFAGFYNYWYKTWIEYEGPYGWVRDEYIDTDSYLRIYGLSSGSVDTLFARRSSHDTTFAIFSDNVSHDYSYDELICYGVGQTLDTIRPLSHHLACYNFSTGVPREIWFRPVNWRNTAYTFQYQFRKDGLLVGFPLYSEEGGAWVHLFDYRNGQFIDSIDLNRNLLNPAFAESTADSALLMTGNVGDTLFSYHFDIVTDVMEGEPDLPSSFTLSQNYPNPFNATTEIRFSLARSADVKLTVYNLLGQNVKTLIDGRTSAGEHRVAWDGTDASGKPCATGVYLYRLQTEIMSECHKMVLLK